MSADRPPGSQRDRPWTLSAIRQLNLQLEAYCRSPGCGWFALFDLDQLIKDLGPEFELPADGPDMPCQKCGLANLEFRLAYPNRASPD
jgi:hypothetical protein